MFAKDGKSGLEFDEAIIAAMSLIPLLFGNNHSHSGTNGSSSAARSGPGVIQAIMMIWKELGLTAADEARAMEAFFSNPNQKDVDLSAEETQKLLALVEVMRKSEKVMFRLALYQLEPETIETVTAPTTDKDGKVTKPATTRKERSGYNPRINVLKGIAALISEDHGNVKKVAEQLRKGDFLGSENKSLKLYTKAKKKAEKELCDLFGVKTLKEITPQLITTKMKELRPKERSFFQRAIERFYIT